MNEPTEDVESIQVEVRTPDNITTKISEVNSEMVSMGLVKMEDSFIQRIRAIGLGTESLGASGIAQGFCVATQTQVFTTMQKLGAMMEKHEADPEMTRGIAYAIGYLADKLTKATKVSIEVVGENRMAQDGSAPQRSRTFKPGEVVGSATRITVEQAFVAKPAQT
jgi:hypothetical protein